MNWDEFSHWGEKITHWATDYHKTLRDRPVRAQTTPGQIAAMLPPDQRVGILTLSAEALGSVHLRTAGVPQDCPVQGLERSGFAQTILGNHTSLDVDGAERDMVAAAQELVADHAYVGAILLECTNMVPYADAIAAATGRPCWPAWACCWA